MDNQKYYYIKLKDSYFEQDNIKVLESLPNGHIFSLILIKMYLKASKYNGQLMMTSSIPYDPNNLEVLASVLNHDVSHVRDAIRAGVKLDLITILDGREIWLTEIQNMIGRSSTEADRIRSYRQRLGVKDAPALPAKKRPAQKQEKPETEEYKQALELAILLESKHKEVDPKFKGNTVGWATHIEKLIRIDKRTVDEIEKVIRWAKEPDNFWFPNIMSGKKLREKFPTLLSQMKRPTTGKKESSLEDIAKKYGIEE